MRTSYVNVATPSASGRPPPGRQPTARSAHRARPPARSLSVASANIFSRRRDRRGVPFVPAPFVALKDARGSDASIRTYERHLRVFLYQTVVPVAGAEIKLVLPESEDLVVDMYAAPAGPTTTRTGRRCAGLGGPRGGGAVQPGAGARQARAGPRHGPRARGHSRGARRRRGGGVDRSRAAAVLALRAAAAAPVIVDDDDGRAYARGRAGAGWRVAS